MKRVAALVAALFLVPAHALSPEAKEFVSLSKKLEPVQCEKRKLRREIAVAGAERQEAKVKALHNRFAELNRDPDTTRMEKRLAELERRMSDGKGGTRDPEDLEAISTEYRAAYYRCG